MNGAAVPSTVRYTFSLPVDEAAVLEDAVRITCRLLTHHPIETRNHLNHVIKWAVRAVSSEIVRRGWAEIPFAVTLREETDAEHYERFGEPRDLAYLPRWKTNHRLG